MPPNTIAQRAKELEQQRQQGQLTPAQYNQARAQLQRDYDAGVGEGAGMRALVPVGRTGLAIAAGYLGLFAFLIVPAPLALLVGILAVVDLKKKPEMYGAGRAWFGIIAGALGTAALVAFLLR